MDTISSRVVAAVNEALKGKPMFAGRPEITAETLFDDIDFDELDRVCATISVEEAFDVEISDAIMQAWSGVPDIIATVRRLMEVV